MIGSVKTRHNRASSINFYYIWIIYIPLAKFRLHTLKSFEVTALQSSSNRKIDLYSKHRENKLQALTKTDLTYEWSNAQTWNLYYCVCHEPTNRLLGKLFLLLPFITATNVKIHEETLITSNRFDITWSNGQFLGCTAIKQRFSSSSCLGKRDNSQVLTVGTILHQEQGV